MDNVFPEETELKMTNIRNKKRIIQLSDPRRGYIIVAIG
jgi:hypothetical protein